MAELCAEQAESAPAESLAEGAWAHSGSRKAADHEARSAVTSASSETPIGDMVERMLSGGVQPDIIVLAVRTAELARGGADPVADRRRAFDREEQRVAARREQNLVNQRNSRARRQHVSADNADTASPSSPPPPSPIAPTSPAKSQPAPPPPELHEKPAVVAKPRPSNRGTRIPDFDELWCLFPRRVGKGIARKAFEKIINSGLATVNELKLGAMRYAAERGGKDPKFTKHPATWLNGECWKDEPGVAHGGNHEASRQPFNGNPNARVNGFAVIARGDFNSNL
jgi:hypothetical protein